MAYSTGALVKIDLSVQLGSRCVVLGVINRPISQLLSLGYAKNSMMPEFVQLADCKNPTQFISADSSSGEFVNWAALLPARVFQDNSLKASFQFTDRSKCIFPLELASLNEPSVLAFLSADFSQKAISIRLVESTNDPEALRAWQQVLHTKSSAPSVPQRVTVPAPVSRRPNDRFEGRFDTIIEGRAEGWVFNHSKPDQRYEVDIYAENRLVAWGKADLFREDLELAKKGDGRIKFSIPLPRRVLAGHAKKIIARVHGTHTILGRHDFKPTDFEPATPRPLLISESQFAKVQQVLNGTEQEKLLPGIERIQVCFENGDQGQARKLLDQLRPQLMTDAPDYAQIFDAQLQISEGQIDAALSRINNAADNNPFSWALWEAKLALDWIVMHGDKPRNEMNSTSESYKEILWAVNHINACMDSLERGHHGS